MGFSRQEYWSGVLLPSLPLDSKEIKPVNLKGDQPWIFTGRWSSSIFLVWCRETTHWKSRWCWERLRAEGKEGNRGWDGWTASPMQWTWTWANSRRWWGTGKSGVLQSTGSQRVRHDQATEQQQTLHMSYPDGTSSKESSGQYRRHRRHWSVWSWSRKIPWRRKWQPTSVCLPGKFQGQRSLVGWVHTHTNITHITTQINI